jgi:hypothetical protein
MERIGGGRRNKNLAMAREKKKQLCKEPYARPSTEKAEAGGSVKPRSSGPAWAIW